MGGEEEGSAHSHDPRDQDDNYEEIGGRNPLYGFWFGNVDSSGDLDVDYLDEDTKEHFAALAGKLGPAPTEIDFSIESTQIPADASEEDYDEKYEDAVDYEDIDEQYEGPEIQAISEEDHLLPKKEFFSSEVSLATFQHSTSVYNEENYDEDEDFEEEHKLVDDSLTAQALPLAVYEDVKSPENTVSSLESLEAESLAVDLEDFQEEDEPQSLQDSFVDKSTTSLPTLCIEDGMVVLRFSDLYGVAQPSRKGENRKHTYPTPKERLKSMDDSDIVEDDEEVFLRGSCQSLSSKHVNVILDDDAFIRGRDAESANFGVWQEIGMSETLAFKQRKFTYLSAEPMKGSAYIDLAAGSGSPSCPKFYPLDLQDWENEIVWGNSPVASQAPHESCTTFGVDSENPSNVEKELSTEQRNLSSEIEVDPDEKDRDLFLKSYPVPLEPFGLRKFSDPSNVSLSKMNHPQLLRFDSRFKADYSLDSVVQKESKIDHPLRGDAIRHIAKKYSSRNIDMLNGSWLDKIVWEPNERISTPKLIFDLQDERMHFEILENDAGHLRFHAGAMISIQSAKLNGGDSFDIPDQGGASVGQFNISNDKYYSYSKSSQQLKLNSRRCKAHGVKVLHSTPALKLQTMKPKLRNKDIANFHRPKALWYPRDNEVAAKKQGNLSTQGPMRIILKSMGGGAMILLVDAKEIVSSVKAKASKKLDLKPSEKVKMFYFGQELEDLKSLSIQNVRPNSVLHLLRTKIHPWPRAQKVPGENKSLRPPGAFKKKSDLSVKDGHVFLMEYCEERPLLLGNVGMGAILCTYYKKSATHDQTSSALSNGSGTLGNVIALDPAEKSPFIGDIRPNCSQLCLETNMYRAPIFPHKLPTTDYLLVRSAKGKLSLRRIDRIHIVGQQEPHMEVISPRSSKSLQTYIENRMVAYMYRECRAKEKRGLPPYVRADELLAQFPDLSQPLNERKCCVDKLSFQSANFSKHLRKILKQCAEFKPVGSNDQKSWAIRGNSRIPFEEELRRMVTPENVCSYESMQAGLFRLKRLGIRKLSHLTTDISSAMNQLPDDAMTLAALTLIQTELQITPWNLSCNFVACTNKDIDNIECLEITGVGDPSGQGLGFSYLHVAPKAPKSSAVVNKKTGAPRGAGPTGTDAELDRLSKKGSRELQQEIREKCQEIWDRQFQSLSAADGDENDSDFEAKSELGSFAGDLEILLDAEGGEAEVGNYELKHGKTDGVGGLKRRRPSTKSQAEEELEDEESWRRKKKKTGGGGQVGFSWQSGFGSESAERTKKTDTLVNQILTAQLDGFTSKENMSCEPKQVFNKKKQTDKPVREGFVCGACGQLGHMKTNKNCPKYGGNSNVQVKRSGTERISWKPSSKDFSAQFQPQILTKLVPAEVSETAEAVKFLPLKPKVGITNKHFEQISPVGSQNSVKQDEIESKSVSKVSDIIISNEMEPEDDQVEPQTPPSIVSRPPMDTERQPPRKKLVIKELKGNPCREGKQRLAEINRRYNEAMQVERKEEQERLKVKIKPEMKYLQEQREQITNHTMPKGNLAAKKRTVVESSGRFDLDYGRQYKHRRGGKGKVGLSNILNSILDGLKDFYKVSYLFLKPVSKKDAPDYFNIIENPMDLSTIREKTRRMEYKSRHDFRRDVWQISYNAHLYNDNRNPRIPPLADQLLELCDHLLDQNQDGLNETEAGI